MLPNLFIQYVTLVADFFIFISIGYYFLKFRSRENDLEKKEGKIDTNYHQVVDNALTRERKILEDATSEADQIITDAHYVSETAKEAINKALQDIVTSIQQETGTTAQTFMNSYQETLKQLAAQSLDQFHNVNIKLEEDLQNQVKLIHETLLPKLEKDLEEYKQTRLQQTEQMIIMIVQKASQEILNKSISLEDHHKLLIESLERAKKEGIFV